MSGPEIWWRIQHNPVLKSHYVGGFVSCCFVLFEITSSAPHPHPHWLTWFIFNRSMDNKSHTPSEVWDGITVRCRYNAVNFLKNIHKRHHIARPLGRGMGCLLWIQLLFDILPQFLQSFMQYPTILDRVTTALDCTSPYPIVNGCIVGVWEWISNFIPHIVMDVITYPCWD